MTDERRMLLAAVLSIGILLIWQLWFVPTPMPDDRTVVGAIQQPDSADPTSQSVISMPSGADSSGQKQAASNLVQPDLPPARNIRFGNDSVRGVISSKGTTFTQLDLLRYRETIDPESAAIELFRAPGQEGSYYAQFGWTSRGDDIANLPGPTARWKVVKEGSLQPDSPLVLIWGDKGVSVTRSIHLDNEYFFVIRDEVTNKTQSPVSAAPWGLLFRDEPTELDGLYILHEGPVGYFDEDGLQELDYDDIDGPRGITHNSKNGWLGITDKYWAGILVPPQGASFKARYTRRATVEGHVVQTDYVGKSTIIEPGSSIGITQYMFAGPKVPSRIDQIGEKWGIAGFELVIDWGIFYFLTKPLATVIEYFNGLVGNFGLAILIVTVLVKVIFFPLAYKSYVAMSKMQKLQPKMLEIREQYADDQSKQQKAMAELYRAEKINPAAGCLPILLQIPVFFSLYKVIYVSILLRHAPFYGWIHDLSAPDPTSLFNLFGLLPFSLPAFLTIGLLPIFMGITMFLQMQLAPMQTTNPIQRKMFTWMPLVFTIVLAPLPAGLIVYWVWSNILSIMQQAFIMRRNGARIALMDNLREIFKRSSKPVE